MITESFLNDNIVDNKNLKAPITTRNDRFVSVKDKK